MAQGEGHRASYGRRLRHMHARTQRCSLSRGGAHQGRAGQSVDALVWRALPSFPACEARRVLRRLEFHYVPKHASWLNMVEIEIGVLRGQCLDRRIATRQQPVSYTHLTLPTIYSV